MQMRHSRRRFLTALSVASAAGLVRTPQSWAREAPPEVTTLRLTKIPGICVAPQYVAEELLKSEGFTDVQYVESGTDIYPAFASNKVDISMDFVGPFLVQLDENVPIVLLGGIHVGCYELFGTERVHAIRDLKGKSVAIPALGSPHHTFAWLPMLALTPTATSTLSRIQYPILRDF
jgi:NitT/TauT family transport system substrate-binding protein